MEIESRELNAARLMIRSCDRLTTKQSLNFNDFIITLNNDDIMSINQLKQVKKIQLLSKLFTKDQYVAQRARGVYIATVSQLQAAFALSYTAQITKPICENAEYLNRCLSWQMEVKDLTFIKLDVETLRIMIFIDLSFVNNKDLLSQIDYVIVLADARNNVNIIH